MAASQSAWAVSSASYIADALLESLCEAQGPRWATLKKNKKPLTPEEREQVHASGAMWSDDRSAVWKSVVNGKTWYVCSTHRFYQVRPTLRGAIGTFDAVEKTA